jgi:hypothetical protein
MNIAVSLLLLALAAVQDPEADRLKKEMQKLKVDNEVLSRQLEVYAAQMKELRESLSKLGAGKGAADDLAREEQLKAAVKAAFAEAEAKQLALAKKGPAVYSGGMRVPTRCRSLSTLRGRSMWRRSPEQRKARWPRWPTRSVSSSSPSEPITA